MLGGIKRGLRFGFRLGAYSAIALVVVGWLFGLVMMLYHWQYNDVPLNAPFNEWIVLPLMVMAGVLGAGVFCAIVAGIVFSISHLLGQIGESKRKALDDGIHPLDRQ